MAEETTATPSFVSRMKKYLKEVPFFCKIIELVRLFVVTIFHLPMKLVKANESTLLISELSFLVT